MNSSSQKKGEDSAILLVFNAQQRRALVIANPTAINQCFVRLAEVNILGVQDLGAQRSADQGAGVASPAGVTEVMSAQ